jgi:hypothetical protein
MIWFIFFPYYLIKIFNCIFFYIIFWSFIIFNGEKFEAKSKEIILNDLFDKHLDNIETFISDSDILQTKIENDRLLEKLITKHLPNFINDLNDDKYKLEKLNELKLLAYNNSTANKALIY